jgi:hypothetical protein
MSSRAVTGLPIQPRTRPANQPRGLGPRHPRVLRVASERGAVSPAVLGETLIPQVVAVPQPQ